MDTSELKKSIYKVLLNGTEEGEEFEKLMVINEIKEKHFFEQVCFNIKSSK
jgi:hypothetical protein